MAKMQYVRPHPKTKILRYRRKVPPDILAVIGKPEFIETFGTRDPREASRLFGPVHTKFEQQIEEARAGNWPPLAEAVYKEWAGRFHEQPMNGYATLKLMSAGQVAESVREFLAASETPFNTPLKVERFTHACLRGHVEHRQHHFGLVPVGAPIVSAPAAPIVVDEPARVPVPTANNLALSVILEKYLADPENREMKSAGEWRMIFRRFAEVMGADMPVRSVTPAHIVKFKEEVAKLPSNLRGREWHVLRDGEWHQLPVPQILERAAKLHLKCLSLASIGKHIGALGSVFMWAKRNLHCDHDPTSGFKVKGDGERRPFTTDELNTIFGDPIYTAVMKPERRNAKYWIPLIALFAGCRLEEIAQATVNDLRQEGGAWVLDVNNYDEKSLKNTGSRRLVPVHKVLLDRGFIAYRNARAAEGTDLFPDVKSSKRQRSAQFSKWWAAHSDRLGITDPLTTFHSLRHNFSDAATEAEIEERVKDTLMGHAGGGTGRKSYGKLRKTVPLKQLVAGMKAISYPGVRIPK